MHKCNNKFDMCTIAISESQVTEQESGEHGEHGGSAAQTSGSTAGGSSQPGNSSVHNKSQRIPILHHMCQTIAAYERYALYASLKHNQWFYLYICSCEEENQVGKKTTGIPPSQRCPSAVQGLTRTTSGQLDEAIPC